MDRRACRYHPNQELQAVPGTYALLDPPPYTVVRGVTGGLLGGAPVDRVSPTSIKVYAWYCPLCTYLELHYE